MLKNLQEHDGVGAVDMEFSALCTVASLRQVACAGLFVVSDELWGDTWKPGFSSHRFRKSKESILSCFFADQLKKKDRGNGKDL